MSAALTLAPDERIVTAYAQRASGPGWSNAPVWVIVRDGNGRLRELCIQPDEQTREMLMLYDVAAAAHDALVRAVQSAARTRKQPRETKR